MKHKTYTFNEISPLLKDPSEPNGVYAVVETPQDDRNKYAYDEKLGLITLKQILPEHLEWPCNFGFIPGTLEEDGDPTDVALVLDEPIFPGCVLKARVLGVIGIQDSDGKSNDRLVACAARMEGSKTSSNEAHELNDLPAALVDRIQHFLLEYPKAKGEIVRFTGRRDAASAMHYILAGIKRRRKQKK